MWFVLKNPVIDLIFAIWGFVFVLQGIIIFSASPVFGGVLRYCRHRFGPDGDYFSLIR